MWVISKKNDNFLRFICFFVDVGTEIVLKVFYYYHHHHPSIVTFPIPRTQPFAKQLQTVFFKSQYYNVTNATSPDDFDINTLITLLRTLFSGVLPTPTYGWGRHPASGDYSISADLLRLRSIRNDIVAHINRASLSSTDFEKLWKTVEEILKRLVQKVDPANEAKLEETFEAYRHKTIGASAAEKYVDCLKKQLDELKQTLKDFILLWKDKQDTPFLRYIKLLIDGGRSILNAYLNKLVKDNNASLHNTLLERQASVLEELGDNQAIIEQVYQIGTEDVKTVNTETQNWDISVLAKVIESMSAACVDEDDLDAIKAIREAREKYANTALRAITSDKRFHDECEDLMLNLSHLARSIGGNSKKKFKRFKDEYRSQSFQMTSDEIDIYLNQLKWPGLDIKDINEIHKECVEKLRAELSTAVNIDVNVKENFELEIMFEIACQDNEKQKEAESILYMFMKAILEDPVLETAEGPDFPEIRHTLDTIRGIPTVRLKCVKKSCIVVTVDCNSRQALISLVDYIDSSMFQNQMDVISFELKDIFDEVFISKGHFTLESIQKTLIRLEGKMSENNSVVLKDEYAQATETIDIYEHMTEDTLTEIPSQSGISAPDIRESATSSRKITDLESKYEQILMNLQEYQQKSASWVKENGFFSDYLKHTTLAYQYLTQAILNLTADWYDAKKGLKRKESEKEEKEEKQSTHGRRDSLPPIFLSTSSEQFFVTSHEEDLEMQQKIEQHQYVTDAKTSASIAEFLRYTLKKYRLLALKVSRLKIDFDYVQDDLKSREMRWESSIVEIQKTLKELKKDVDREKDRLLQFKLEIARLEHEKMQLESSSDPRIVDLHKTVKEVRHELSGEKSRSQKLEKEKTEIALSLEIAEKKLAELTLERSEGIHSYKQDKRERRLSF